jgi:hypothetical protein
MWSKGIVILIIMLFIGPSFTTSISENIVQI